MALSGVGATPNEPPRGDEGRIKQQDQKNTSIFARQDIDQNGEITGEELIEKERFSNIYHLTEKLTKFIKKFKVQYDVTNEQSVKKAENKVEKFIEKINEKLKKIAIKDLKDGFKYEQKEYGDDASTKGWTIAQYRDIDGNYHSDEYQCELNELNEFKVTFTRSTVETPNEHEENLNNIMKEYVEEE